MDYLTSLAIATTFYDDEKNYFDTYFPFILILFENKNFLKVSDISNEIHKKNLKLPIYSIKTILSEKTNIFKIDKNEKDWDVSLQLEGKEILANLINDQKKLNIKLNNFYNAVQTYYKQNRNEEISIDEVKENINIFLKKHLVEISINKFLSEEYKNQKLSTTFENSFSFFMASIKECNSEFCDTFDLLWRGTVVWNELTKTSMSKKELSFKKIIDVYLA